MPRILCLTWHNVFGQDYGAVLRTRHIFQLLARLGEVHVVLVGGHHGVYARTNKSAGSLKLVDVVEFQSTGKWSVLDRFRNEFDRTFINTDKEQARAIDRARLHTMMAAHDLVWIHGLTLANRYGIWRWPNSVLDLDDIISSLYRTRLRLASDLLEKLRHWRQVVLWRRRERCLGKRFDALCVCSERDRQELGGGKEIFVLPNGFTAPKNTPVRNPVTPPRLGFIGTFTYEPNRDGVRWFVQKVWPLILEKMPDVRLRLVGAGSEKGCWQDTRNIDALGFLANTESEMATWSASVVPLFVGGGTRIKIAESFSRLCPVVATSLGAYGYDVTDGNELWLADSPTDFAVKCLRTLTDAGENQAMAGRAWEKFLQHWTWNAQAGRVAAIVQSVLRQKG
jgi:glycosyltransferase involved in cell wall biosynthesis